MEQCLSRMCDVKSWVQAPVLQEERGRKEGWRGSGEGGNGQRETERDKERQREKQTRREGKRQRET